MSSGSVDTPSGAPRLAVDLKVVQPRDSRVALGMAVNYLMTDPAFARLPFGQWSRVLVGQINRRHFVFVIERDKVVGFVGWAFATKAKAEAWLTANRDLSFADSKTGEIVLANVWKASTPAANRFLVQAFRSVIRGKQMIYTKRFYRDGRIRPVRVAVNSFVKRHIDRGLSRADVVTAGFN